MPDPITLVSMIGLVGVFAFVFAETGLFFGFFLPGDSLLFTAGLLASQGLFSFPLLLVGSILAAIIGDQVGYWFGKKIGPRIFTREDSFFFKKKHVETTHAFYEKYGPRTVLIARLIPIIRTFAPILAGVGDMKYRTFVLYNIIGGVVWVTAFTTTGYLLGGVIGNNLTIIGWIVGGVIFVSVIPILKELIFKMKKKNIQV